MVIGTCELFLTAEWVSSLKEKRTVLKGITERARNKFNISIAEVGSQDSWKTINIGYACVSNDAAHAENMVHTVLSHIEKNTDAVVDETIVEILHSLQ